MTHIIKMQYYKSTKGTHVYKAIPSPTGEKHCCESVYLEKAQLGPVAPQTVEISVTWRLM